VDVIVIYRLFGQISQVLASDLHYIQCIWGGKATVSLPPPSLQQIEQNMAEKKEGTEGTASEWWMDYLQKAAASLSTTALSAIKFDCPRCNTNLRDDPQFLQKVLQGATECPKCKYDLKELLTDSAVLIGSTVGKSIAVECPYCGKSAPGNTYGGNITERWVICPNCGRDLFDPSAQY